MKRITSFKIYAAACIVIAMSACENKGPASSSMHARPKIVVGLMVDQMRWDYMYKYSQRYGEGGFKRLLREGFSCENTLISHAPTVTAIGHSSVYTGSVPAITGIVGNSWYDREWGRQIENVEDTTVTGVGGKAGNQRSPRNLLTTTIGDELRMATNYQSKVVGVSIKDRGAILPAGHTANGAFWYDNDANSFITSTYYMNELPDWASRFNAINWKDSLMPGGWNTLYPLDSYTLSDKDDKTYEGTFSGEDKPVFPHTKADITNTPFGNTITFEFAKSAIEGYKLGEGAFTDMLAVSVSSPDKIGHRFGPNSIEVEDNYLRLDKDLENFFNYLDKRYGKDGYLFFITADHGANHSPGYLQENKIPSDAINEDTMKQQILASVKGKYGTADVIQTFTNGQIYLNYDVLAKKGLDRKAVAAYIADLFSRQKGYVCAVSRDDLATAPLPERIKSMFINGCNLKRSGDVFLIRSAGWKSGSLKGTAHGDWYPYDAHIPLVWLGHGIKHGKTNRTTGMVDIAPTLAALLQIQMPSGNIGEVITEISDQYMK
ncbi:alkaline phosphatase PafA [Chitinophaga sp. MM2321]|uniref:alkaline phosphatase PafA n=1 Tax=Chitinophaga sp. MM2321 TaxID=3137178 RepID=UPI0032D57AAE